MLVVPTCRAVHKSLSMADTKLSSLPPMAQLYSKSWKKESVVVAGTLFRLEFLCGLFLLPCGYKLSAPSQLTIICNCN